MHGMTSSYLQQQWVTEKTSAPVEPGHLKIIKMIKICLPQSGIISAYKMYATTFMEAKELHQFALITFNM